jgi:hypothetical protein
MFDLAGDRLQTAWGWLGLARPSSHGAAAGLAGRFAGHRPVIVAVALFGFGVVVAIAATALQPRSRRPVFSR